MLITPSKTASGLNTLKLQTEPEWITVMGRDGVNATNARATTTRTKAWWDLVADMIVGRR